MKKYLLVIAGMCAGMAHGSPCTTAPLTTYLNGGAPYSCTENGGAINVVFNHDLLASYVGLAVLPANNSAANPASITVTPGSSSLTFTSNAFDESSTILSSQAELVHFLLESSTTPFTSTTFSLIDPEVSRGTPIFGPALGTGLVIGQELVCVGGTFTSLPVGIVTSVANGLLGSGAYGCNGTALIGTAAVSSGPLSAITNLLALPNLSGVTDTAYIQFSPVNGMTLDVIKLQALVTILGGTASTSGFGNTFTQAAVQPVPEPQSFALFGAGALALAAVRSRLKRRTGSIK
jgi:hypothetical protein